MCDWDTQTYRAWTEMVEKEKRDAREGESGLGVSISFHIVLYPALRLCYNDPTC